MCVSTCSSPLGFYSSLASSQRSQPSLHRRNSLSMSRSVRIAVVGDVHDDWDLQEDARALSFLQPDLVLFTGDFGNENVELVRSISNLNVAKAAILGNHDCWNTHRFSEKKKDRVQLQLECLGEQHVGYGRLDFPTLKLSVVGGRPFSCGGDKLFRQGILSARYGVSDMAGSAKKICEAAVGTPEDYSIIFLAHNGPTGLGTKKNAICGKDWVSGGGDHGDRDLADAISQLKQKTQLSIPLVVFGHMHKELAYRSGFRKMIVVGLDNIVYLNGAIVPRVKLASEQGTGSRRWMKGETPLSAIVSEGTLRAFTVIEILDGRLEEIAETWVAVCGDKAALQGKHLLFQKGKKLFS